MLRIKLSILISFLVLTIASLSPAFSFAKEYYIWTDDAGTVHVTDDPAKAPVEHRVVKYPEPAVREAPAPEPSITEIERLILQTGDKKGVEKEKPAGCKALDIREFGLISDSFTDPWSEATLVEKYGPPCEIIHIGDVFVERSFVKEKPETKERARVKTGFFAEKKQYVYRGSDSDKTSIITIVNGVVVRKERIYD